LLYLLLYSGIIAKYDGIRISKERVTPQGRIFKKSVSHVLRIQRIDDIKIVSEFLRGKIKDSVDEYIKNNNKTTSSPPHGLPVRELNIKDSLSKYNWRIEKILKSSSRNHISPKFIEIDNIKDDFLKKIINGDIAFDRVEKIEEIEYNGDVYDLSVPGPQNFLGGCGGIFLHNSAHIGRKELIGFIKKVNPGKIICMHGDECPKFAKELKQEYGFDTIAPKNGDILSI